MKKYYNLRIFIYGENALDDIKYLFKNYEKEFKIDTRYKIKIYITKDKEKMWEYYMIPGEFNNEKNIIIEDCLRQNYENENKIKMNEEYNNLIDKYYRDSDYNQLNEKISELLAKYTKFYDVLIIIANKLLDTNSRIIFKYFQGLNKNKSKSPFMLFLTKKDNSPKVLDLFELIDNEFYDKRNVYAYKFPTNDIEIELINKFCINCMNYYHELGNCDNNFENHTFNILTLGQAGTGKSTFINQFIKEKVAKEGEGILSTHKITSYLHPNYPIKIIDTPGFENLNSVLNIYKLLNEFETKTKEPKKRIDLILYFINMNERCFLSIEIELVKFLIIRKKKIIFVLNKIRIYSQREVRRLTEIFKESLIKIAKSMPEYKYMYIDNITDNIITIKLKQDTFQEETEEEDKEKEHIIIKQCDGMDKLFKRIHEMFEKHKISIIELEKNIDNYKLIDFVKKYELLEHFRRVEDEYIYIIINSARLILSYGKTSLFGLFFKENKRKELLEQLISMNSDKYKDTDSLYNKIEDQINQIKNKDEVVNDFFNSLLNLRKYFDTSEIDFEAFYNNHTILIGYFCLKEFEKEYGQYDIKTTEYLKELGGKLNVAIDGFFEISKEWENIYKSLKEHKSNEEWLNKYFIVKIPKY